jgi:hypothetical protein
MDKLDQEGREEQLREFVRSALARQAAAKGALVLLAKAPNSAVARALFSLSTELASVGISAEIVFASGSTVMAGDTWNLSFDPTFAHETRLLRDHRYLDGHEQLIFGHHTWFGECMRREADKRDAYSAFVRDNAEMAARGRRTFAALWASAERIYTHVAIERLALAPALPVKHDAPPMPAVADALEAWRPALQH